MELSRGDLVSVDTGGPKLDAIVHDLPSPAKVVVAVVDPTRGPVLRPVATEVVSERTEDGPHDAALRLLLRRTPPPEHGKSRGGKGGGHGRAGFGKPAMHRRSGSS
jgi:hypothetical protein